MFTELCDIQSNVSNVVTFFTHLHSHCLFYTRYTQRMHVSPYTNANCAGHYQNNPTKPEIKYIVGHMTVSADSDNYALIRGN